MKKLILFLLLIPIFSLAQFKAGRYIIKQAVSNMSLRSDEYHENFTKIDFPCDDYKVHCENQIFDIIDRGGFFFIKLANKNLFLSLVGDGTYNYDGLLFKARNPRSLEHLQQFYIIDNGNGSYYIKPKLPNNETYYIGTRMDLFPNNGSDLKFIIKDQAHPREYNDFRNASWTFYEIKPNLATKAKPDVKNVIPVLPRNTNAIAPNPKLELQIKTGADNLEHKDFMEDLKITVKFRGKPDLVKENVNNGGNWDNNSNHRITFELPSDYSCADLTDIVFTRYPKNHSWNNIDAISADNWKLQKVSVYMKMYVNGVLKSNKLDFISPSGSSTPLFIFVYEGGDEKNSGQKLILPVGNRCVN